MREATYEVDLRLRVTKRTTATEDVVVLDLRDPSGADLPAWAPGAHVDVHLAGGLVRQYSLCGATGDQSYWRIAVLLEPQSRGGSRHVHTAVKEGMEVAVRGPRNNFPLVPSPRYLFVAGGIGITPILPMLINAEAIGADWELHYGGRSRRSMAFLETLDDATDARVTVHPQDEVGLIDLDSILSTAQPETLVYCCGPEPLLAAVEQRCATSWPSGRLHVERFAPKDVGDPVHSGSFEVVLANSNLTLTVPPDKSILEVVEQAGVPVLSSCEEGTCGTCETPVLEGAVDHRDSLLTVDQRTANDTMYICVSRAAGSRLVLEL